MRESRDDGSALPPRLTGSLTGDVSNLLQGDGSSPISGGLSQSAPCHGLGLKDLHLFLACS